MKNHTLTHYALALLLASLSVTPAQAATDGSVSMGTNCDTVTIRVDNIQSATGWGAHFSTSSAEDGYGGRYPECHLTPDSSDNLYAFCYDGYQDATHHTNSFRADLGPRADLQYVSFTVGERGVNVVAQRESNNAYTTEIIPYPTNSYFPLRSGTGFCAASTSTLYYKANGVMPGTAGRTGTGYSLSVTAP